MSFESAGPLQNEIYQFLEEVQKKPVEDRRLKNWTVWLKRRKKQYDKLCPALDRTPECLAMNYEKNQNDNLDKCLIEEAKLFTYEDKYRGSPLFWTTVKPTKEGRKNGIQTLVYPANVKFREDPEAFVRRGYTDIPAGIIEEKCEKPCPIKTRKPWGESKVLKQRKEELASKLNLLEPFRPDLKDVMIKGVGYKMQKHESEYSILKPTIEYDLICEKTANLEATDTINPPLIKIGNVTISPQNCVEDLNNDFNWYLTFSNKTVHDIHTQSVLFENRGTTAVHYRWEEVPPPTKNFPIKYSRFRMPRFFFDTNPGIMVPGQQFSIEFIFRSTTPGNFRQVWELKTIPMLRSVPIHFILQAVAVDNPSVADGKTWEDVEIYIRNCVKEALVKQIIDDVDWGIKPLNFRTKYYGLFLEKEIFEYINPSLNYKPYPFQAVKELRSKVATDKWDLDMQSIRKDIIRNEKDCELRHEYINQLNTISAELKAPLREGQLESIKYETAYTIMSTFVNQFSKSASYLQQLYNVKPPPGLRIPRPKFDLSPSLEDLRVIKLIEESSEDEEGYFKDFTESLSKKPRDQKGSTMRRASKKRGSSMRRASKKRGSSMRRASKKRGSSMRRASKKRGSSMRRGSQKRRASTKKQSPKPGGDKDVASKAAKAATKPAFIKLTVEKEKSVEKIIWEPEPNREVYKNLLTAHVRDYLEDAIDKICRVVDSCNSSQPDVQPSKYVSFPYDGPKEVILPEKPQIQKNFEKNAPETDLLKMLNLF